MYRDLKELFGKEEPSGKKFRQKLSLLSAEKQEFYWKAAYEAAFCDWEKMPVHYQQFITRLLMHNKEETMAWFRNKTVIGSLRFPLNNPLLVRKLLSLVEGQHGDKSKDSYIHLAFCLCLAFDYEGSVEYLGDLLRKEYANTDELCELMEFWKWTNESGYVKKKR